MSVNGPALRYLSVDALRGVAIVLMVAFHFCFDLAFFGLAAFDFYRDPLWLHLRTLILTLFLGLVGVSLVLAARNGLNGRRYWRRLLVLVVGALAVSLSTWWLFGPRFVFFGALHFIALASVLGLAFLRGYWVNLVAGAGLIVFSNRYAFSWFDQVGLRWVGLMTHKPATEDYVPLLPWFGVVLIGMFAGERMIRSASLNRLDQRLRESTTARGLAVMGRHSLSIYLLHQPVLMASLFVYTKIAT